MGRCICCGKSLGGMDIPVKLSPDLDSEFCMKCYNNFNDDISQMESAQSLEEFNKYAENILKKVEMFRYRPEVRETFLSYIYKMEADKFHTNEWIKPSEELKKQKNNFMMTTGFGFEGYNITAYKGIVSESVVLGTGFASELKAGLNDLLGTSSEAFSEKINTARNSAAEKLVEKSIGMGCNALIGVYFNYITLSNNMIGVIASGTGVVIEKFQKDSE